MNNRTLLTIYAIAIILRVVWISVPPLWYDENFTLLLSRMEFANMIRATMTDVHPPLWYIITWAVYYILPDAPAWFIRVPACVFSIASLGLFDLIMRRFDVPVKVHRVALLLMGILPMQIWYAQEGRMYALLEFFVLITLFAALDRRHVLTFIGALGLLYTQNYGPFYLAAIALVVFARKPFDLMFNGLSKWTYSAMFSAGALWLPWVTIVQSQMDGIAGKYWIMDRSVGAIVVNIYKVFFTASVPETFFFASYAVTFVALIAGCFALARSKHPARLSIVVMAFLPLVIAMLVSWLWQPVILFRPLIGISPFLYLATAWSLESV